MFSQRQIAEVLREVQPNLDFRCFGVRVRDFEHERVLISSLSMCFYQIGSDASRCTPNLVGERVDFVLREKRGLPEDIESEAIRQLKYLEIAVSEHYLPPAACILPPGYF